METAEAHWSKTLVTPFIVLVFVIFLLQGPGNNYRVVGVVSTSTAPSGNWIFLCLAILLLMSFTRLWKFSRLWGLCQVLKKGF